MNRMPAAVEMNAPTPDPEVPAKVARRQFTTDYRRLAGIG